MIATVDIGGTKTLIAVFDNTGTIVERVKFPTPLQYEDFKIELAKSVAKLSTKDFDKGVIGIRGNIDREAGIALKDDVLAWRNVTISADCNLIFGCQFYLENDSKLAGLSEALRVPSKYQKVLYITISTGIGTSYIVNHSIDSNTINSEVGKSLYYHDGSYQQWEDFASGKAIATKYGKRASELKDPAAWEDISLNLAVGFINVAAAFTPDLIIVGGGVGTHYEKFQQYLEHAIASLKPDEITMPPIRKAQFPEEAVIYGCYAYAQTV